MRILLVCAGGLSTGLLMKKMEAYWKEIGEPLQIRAAGLADYAQACQEADVVLVGPQVAYHFDEISRTAGIPCAAIDSTDYALGNCASLHDQAQALLEKAEA